MRMLHIYLVLSRSVHRIRATIVSRWTESRPTTVHHGIAEYCNSYRHVHTEKRLCSRNVQQLKVMVEQQAGVEIKLGQAHHIVQSKKGGYFHLLGQNRLQCLRNAFLSKVRY